MYLHLSNFRKIFRISKKKKLLIGEWDGLFASLTIHKGAPTKQTMRPALRVLHLLFSKLIESLAAFSRFSNKKCPFQGIVCFVIPTGFKPVTF